jgi:hypothetical protein
MALFRKKKEQQTIAELENYYATGKKTSTVKAWIMAFLSLLVTVAVLAAVFLGGRWAYRTVTDRNDNSPSTTETAGNDTQNGSVNSDGNSSSDNSRPASPENGGVVTDEAASTNSPSNQRPGSSTPVTGDNLPDTGMGEMFIILPVITLGAGYIVARKYQLR